MDAGGGGRGRGLPLDLAAARGFEEQLSACEGDRGRAHLGVLRTVLALVGVYEASGAAELGLSTVGPTLRCSDFRAATLLRDAEVLLVLPEAQAALATGLLTVEQSRAFVEHTSALQDGHRLEVWLQLLTALEAEEAAGSRALAPARLKELLLRWVVAADPAAAAARRKSAAAEGSVGYRQREDGLTDLFLNGVPGPLAQACLARIRARAAAVGPDDERSADKRRLDAGVDLILGRLTVDVPADTELDPDLDPGPDHPNHDGGPGPCVDPDGGPGPLADSDGGPGHCADSDGGPGQVSGLPFDADPDGEPDMDPELLPDDPALTMPPAPDDSAPAGHAPSPAAAAACSADHVCGPRPAPCGCTTGAAVPCGTGVSVLVPLGAALGTTDELAELAGHGPLDPDLLAQLLLAGPVLRPVWVDQDGVPVAVGDTVERPARDDPQALRAALLRLAAQPPPAAHPRHPDDHQPHDQPHQAHQADPPDGHEPRDRSAKPGDDDDCGPGTGARSNEGGPQHEQRPAATPHDVPSADAARARPEPRDRAVDDLAMDDLAMDDLAVGDAAVDVAAADGLAVDDLPADGRASGPTVGLLPQTGGSLTTPAEPHTAAPAGDAAAAGAAAPKEVGGEAGRAGRRGWPHPPGTPGRYRPGRALFRLLQARAPRCEWPSCGVKAVRCDQDHDLAHPAGPTCACDLGSLCRHHHRIKKAGWGKRRDPAGVRWTSPTGQVYLSPHQPPAATVRPLPPVVLSTRGGGPDQ